MEGEAMTKTITIDLAADVTAFHCGACPLLTDGARHCVAFNREMQHDSIGRVKRLDTCLNEAKTKR
jgi:hypothetical protein